MSNKNKELVKIEGGDLPRCGMDKTTAPTVHTTVHCGRTFDYVICPVCGLVAEWVGGGLFLKGRAETETTLYSDGIHRIDIGNLSWSIKKERTPARHTGKIYCSKCREYFVPKIYDRCEECGKVWDDFGRLVSGMENSEEPFDFVCDACREIRGW